MQVDTDDICDVPVRRYGRVIGCSVNTVRVVPVDGELLSPEASLDESSLTGESLPVTRRTGDAVLVATTGVAIAIRAAARVEDSQYERIVALVEEASRSRAPLVRLADRYAVPFTAVSLLIAGSPGGSRVTPYGSQRCSCWRPRARCSLPHRSRSSAG